MRERWSGEEGVRRGGKKGMEERKEKRMRGRRG